MPEAMVVSKNDRSLTKFFVLSVVSFGIGTLHGMLQVMPPIRHWLDSVGSPYGGPGHMIDPLAHAHMNLVGGVVLLAMGVTYYVVPRITQRQIASTRLTHLTFWCTALGAYGFYVVQMVFGIWEGSLLHSAPQEIATAHRYYVPSVAVSANVMALGFLFYFLNIILTFRGRSPATPS